MIRKATMKDVNAIARTYEELLIFEKENGSNSNWEWNVYPTAAVPESKIPAGSMYVLEEEGEICASMVLNQDQAEEYAQVDWLYPAKQEEVLVIHTLCVRPSRSGNGYGRMMVQYAKQYAVGIGCSVVRIDTYAHNEPAKRLYQNNGFRIAGYGRILLQGLIDEDQVYLECKLEV